MIHILHHQEDEIINWINHVKSDNHEQSVENDEKYNFIVSVDEPGAADVGSRSRILIPGEEGDYREFIVNYTFERTANMEKEVYTRGSFIDIGKLKHISPQVLDAQTIQTAAGMVLSGLGWQVGIVEYSGIRKWTIETHMDAYEALKAIASLFDCELRFRVTVEGDQVAGRYVDFIKKQGLNRGKETLFGKDLIGITRRIDSDRIVTALHCIGPERQDGTRLEVTVENDEAFQNWNWHGHHLTQLFFPETADQDMTLERLTQLGQTELKKRIAAAIEYEVEAASLEHIFGYEHEITRLGDSVKIKDEHFNPPMYLESRVIFVDRSVFNKAKKSYKLGEVIEYKQEDIMKTWRELQALYATKVIKSPTAPPGKPNIIWIKTGGTVEIAHTWDAELNEWVKVTPTEASEVGAETPEEAQKKANTARDEAKTYTNQQLTNYVSNTTYQQDITEIQNQIDGNITSWFYAYDPTLSNAPANTWTTTDDKNTHLGDLFYNTSSGYAWRFALESGVYKWISVKDTDVTKALSDAAKAQDTADEKRRTFVSQPVPPYDIGDLWANGQTVYRCKVAKASGGSYAVGDWEKIGDVTNQNTSKDTSNVNGVPSTEVIGRISTAESSITQNANEISLRVTKTDFNKLEVSGRNLIIRKDEEVNKMVSPDGTITTLNLSNLMKDFIPVVVGEEYMFTQEPIAGGGDDYFRYAFYAQDKTTVVRRSANNGTKFKDTVPTGAYWLRVSYDANNKVKLEKGNKATGWSPAPEDVASDINNAEQNAKNHANKISTKGLGMKMNFSDFYTGNGGELYMHGYDSNGNAADVDGYLLIGGEKETVTKGMVNPNRLVPYGYITYSTASGWFITEPLPDGTFKLHQYGHASDNTIISPSSAHRFVGLTRMNDAENFTESVLWNDWKDHNEIKRLSVYEEMPSIKNRITTAESSITQQANQIALKVSQTTYEEFVNEAKQSGSANMIHNCEWKENSDKWTWSSGWARDTSKVFQGSITQKVEKTGLTADAWPGIYSELITVAEGQDLTASVYSFTDDLSLDEGRGYRMEIEWYDSTTRISMTSASIKPSKINTWERFSVSGSAPPGTVKGRVRFHPTRNGKLWIARPMLQFGKMVTAFTPHVDELAKELQSRMSSAESSITQQANQISQKVSSTDYNGNTIASLINQTATEILIRAAKIALDGYVEAKHIKSLNGLNINDQFIIDALGNVTMAGKLKAIGYSNYMEMSGDRFIVNYDSAPVGGRTLFSVLSTIPNMFDGNYTDPEVKAHGKLYTHTARIWVPAQTFNTSAWVEYTLDLTGYDSVGMQVVSAVSLQSRAKEMYAYERVDGRYPTVGDLRRIVIRLSPHYNFTSPGFYVEVDVMILGWR